MSEKILAGIVVFNPDTNLINLVDSLVLQNVDVFLYINKSNNVSELILKLGKSTISKENNGYQRLSIIL